MAKFGYGHICLRKKIWLVLWGYCVNSTFNNISVIFVAVSFIVRGNRNTRRKPPTCLLKLFVLYLALARTGTSLSVVREITLIKTNIVMIKSRMGKRYIQEQYFTDAVTRQVSHEEQELLTIMEHLRFSGVRVARSVV